MTNSTDEKNRVRERINRGDEAGFSLIELMIVVAVMLIISAAVLSQMSSALRISTTTFEMTDAQHSLRISQDHINRDLVSTGDGLRGINNIRLPVNFVRSYLTTNPVVDQSDPNIVIFPIITSDDNVAASTPVLGAQPAVNIRSGTDRITLLMIDPSFAPLSLPASAINSSGANITVTAAQFTQAAFQAGEIYFVSSGYAATFGVITSTTGSGSSNRNIIFASGGATDPYGLNVPGDSGAGSNRLVKYVAAGPSNQPLPTTLMRVQLIQHFINAQNLFIRRVFGVGGGGGFVDSVIAEHVIDLQLRYILADASQPVSQLATPPQQIGVRQVEVTLTTETAHPLGNGMRQHLSATSTTSVRNLQFRQAL